MYLYFIGYTVLSVFGAKMFFVNKENISILDYFDTVLVHINYRVATLVKYSKIYKKIYQSLFQFPGIKCIYL